MYYPLGRTVEKNPCISEVADAAVDISSVFEYTWKDPASLFLLTFVQDADSVAMTGHRQAEILSG